MYAPWELSRAADHPDPFAYYSMLFAAKEAVSKAFGTRWDVEVSLSDIEIRDGDNGEPVAAVHGHFEQLATERGGAVVLVSLSHDGPPQWRRFTITALALIFRFQYWPPFLEEDENETNGALCQEVLRLS